MHHPVSALRRAPYLPAFSLGSLRRRDPVMETLLASRSQLILLCTDKKKQHNVKYPFLNILL